MNVQILGNRLFFLSLFCQRQHEKKNIYNLNEDEELTHYGQSLADIEKHHGIVDSDSDGEERGALSGKGRSSGTVRRPQAFFLPCLGTSKTSLGKGSLIVNLKKFYA